MAFRSNAGTHTVLDKLYPGQCINCGLPETMFEREPCRNHLYSSADIRKMKRKEDRANSKVSEEDNAFMDDFAKRMFK